MVWLRTSWLPALAASVGLVLLAEAQGPLETRHLRVNGVDLSYIEQGTGAPVVFVHGAVADLRFWEPQREAIARQHRFIAYTYRYHGTAPWPDDGKQYSAAAHAADLAAFIRGLHAGPVHLVGLSYGGSVAALVATEHADLLRSLTLVEPGLFSLADTPEAKPALDEWNKGLEPALAALKAGDAAQGTKLLIDLVSRPGTFEKYPDPFRQMFLDNARTLPLALSVPFPATSCAQLGGVKVPTLVVGGDQTLRIFSSINDAIVRCVPGSRLAIVPKATHVMSFQNPAAFNDVLLKFLAKR
jgi:pimeloyl-ACP methyl ester carboxylesterase